MKNQQIVEILEKHQVFTEFCTLQNMEVAALPPKNLLRDGYTLADWESQLKDQNLWDGKTELADISVTLLQHYNARNKIYQN